VGDGGANGDVAGDECHYCGKRGHWARECKKKKCHEEVHVAQAEEEDDPTLLLASATITDLGGVLEQPAVHLNEAKLFVQLGDGDHSECARWILDSGTTNHMIG
jgi:hypothetical protein